VIFGRILDMVYRCSIRDEEYALEAFASSIVTRFESHYELLSELAQLDTQVLVPCDSNLDLINDLIQQEHSCVCVTLSFNDNCYAR
jgi:hypothetical protein